MSSPFKKLIDRANLQRLAGQPSFSRGEDYYESGQVRSLMEDGSVITATVHGTHPYRVELVADGTHLDFECTCPVGDGDFCKHCVAVGLTWLDEHGAKRHPPEPTKRKLTMDDVREFLERQDKKVLVELLAKRAMEDERLLEQLLLKTAKGRASGPDVDALKAAIDGAIQPDDYVGWREAYDYSTTVDGAVDTVAEVLEDGHPEVAIELAEHALGSVESALSMVDDSDGYMGGMLERLQELHLAACKQVKPDPEALAERLFMHEMNSGFSVFYQAAKTYADVLGAKGLARYRRLADQEWARVRPLGPSEDDPEKYGRRSRISHIMEALAEQSGDVEAQVAVLAKDLSHAYNFLRIAEVYKKARKPEKGLEWAERGLRTFPARPDSRLREFVAEEYHRLKRHDDAMALIWAEYEEGPALETYKLLKAHADRTKGWKSWRERALAFLRQEMAKRKSGQARTAWFREDSSTLVEIFLWEKKHDEAWAEAKSGGCSNGLWLQLAGIREAKHPADAVGVYRKQVEITLRHASNDAYAQAVKFLGKVHDLETRLGHQREFAAFLAAVREEHRRKRNFMALLSGKGWS